MATDPNTGSGDRGYPIASWAAPDRLSAFSDGVMAVIITIMAFDLHPPAGHTWAALRQRGPNLLAYLFSFVYIGIYWNNHHHVLRATERISASVMWANLHLLFWLSLVPVLTGWVAGEYRHSLPAAAYGAAALGAAIAYWMLIRAIIRANGYDSKIAVAIGSDFKGRISELFYATGIGMAFVSPWIAYGLYTTVAAIWFIPDRRLDRSRGA